MPKQSKPSADPIIAALEQYTLEELKEIAKQIPVIAKEKEEKRLAWEKRKAKRKLSMLSSQQKPQIPPLPHNAIRRSVSSINVSERVKKMDSELVNMAAEVDLDLSGLLADAEKFQNR